MRHELILDHEYEKGLCIICGKPQQGLADRVILVRRILNWWKYSYIRHRLQCFRDSLRHLHDWEYDCGEYSPALGRDVGECWTCGSCCAVASPKHNKPMKWSPFHEWH